MELDYRPQPNERTTISVSMRPLVRLGDREWPLHDLDWKPGDEPPCYRMWGPAKDFPVDAKEVTVVLQPAFEKLVGTVDRLDVWDQALTFDQVPVRVFGLPASRRVRPTTTP